MTATLVQPATNTATSGTSLVITFSANVTAGNAVVVAIGTEFSTSNPTVSGITLGSTALTKANSENQNTTGTDIELWILANAPSGQNTLTVTFTGGSGTGAMCGLAQEWSGMATTGLLDVHPAGSTARSTSWSSGSSGTLTNPDEVIVGAVMVNSGTVTGPGTTWTNNTQVTANSKVLATGYIITSSTTAETWSGTVSATEAWSAIIISLNQSGSSDSSSGSIAVPAPAMSGTATVPVTASGSLAAATPAITGSGTVPVTATAAMAVPGPAMHGTAAVITASGSLAAAAPAMHGTAQVVTPKLLVSIALAAGTDDYGNSFEAGFTAYDTNGTWAQLSSGALNFANGATVSNAVAGLLDIINGSTGIDLNDNTGEIDLSATAVNVNGNNLAAIFGILDPSGYPLSGSATLSAVIATLNSTIQRLQNVGIFQ